MLHIQDRLNRSICGSMDGEAIPFTVWRWKQKSETCKRCARQYKARKSAFIQQAIGIADKPIL